LASRLTPEKNQATPVWGGEVLQHIDWKQPWFQPWAKTGEAIAEEAMQKRSVAQALNSYKDQQSIHFVNQSELPPEQPYEAFIFQQKKVPTRDGLHDFFNGLCWQRFPTSKHRLNQLQAQEIAKQGIGSTRGAVRDALTLFDENAVLWQGPDVLWQALQARDWFKLFVELRDQWQHVHMVLFGHALLEKLVTPYKSITGHVYRVSTDVPPHDDAALDAWVAQDLQTDKLATKPFEPLPVLGVPNWWADNAAPAFYQDTQVFRPKRMPASQY
jgi:Protein of unknown function (DUF3025)